MKLNNKKIRTHYSMGDTLFLNQLFDEIKYLNKYICLY